MFSISMSADYLYVKFAILFLFSINHCFCQSHHNCLGVNLKPTVCTPGAENVVRLRNILVSPTHMTCGNPATDYCRPKPRTECPICNASKPSLSHGPEKMQDKDFQSSYWGNFYQPTWWQSITWWDALQRGQLTDNTIKVNLTLAMNKSYDITGDIKITFYSSKPNAMIIEKSIDYGVTWIPLRFYADNCNTRFGSSVPLSSVDKYQAICIQAANTAAIQGSEIMFNLMQAFPTESLWQASIQQYIMATDIRIRLEYPWTDGNHVFPQRNFLNQYYYDVTDLQIFGRCHCNGHAPYCKGQIQQQVCDCQHNTEGVDCERCKPLYNNKTWKAAEANDKPNPCEKCQCNDHAQSCAYNSTLGFGICTDCNHNTTGFLCDKCKDKFYRNVSLPVNNAKVCSPCDCFALGITNNGSCTQLATSNMSMGQCFCKDNFRGRRCDSCKDGFYGVTVSPIGECKACNCSTFGTFNNSVVCDQISGQCICKSSIDGKQCTNCKDGYYSFPNVTDGQCRLCFCNQGGAYSNTCNKTSGHCFCRTGITSESCSMTKSGYFYPDFDFLTIEGESVVGNNDIISNIIGEGTEFTGRGYARLRKGSSITIYFQSPFQGRYSMITRYKLKGTESLQLLQTFFYSNNSVSLHLFSFNISLPSSNTSIAQTYYQRLPMDFMANGNYSVTITMINATQVNQTLDIDSVVFMWDYENTKFFQSSNQTIQNATAQCWKNSQTISMNSQVSSLCKTIEFAVNTELFNGSLACNCNIIGSFNSSTCEEYGGQCKCKPGVTGRTCNQCKPGFYNFSSSGCTACNCTTLGSTSLVCDVVSGKCLCKPGVVNRTCSQCRDSFYGFQTGQGCRNCSCNWDGSLGMYCGENGLCHCKNTTTGTKCDRCKPMHFNFTSDGCMPCRCHPSGSTNLQCNLQHGNCSCKQNVQGAKCSLCGPGTFNLQQSNPYGCQSCFCFNKTEQCSSATSFYSSSISSSFINTTNNWIITSRNGLIADYKNTSLGVSLPTVNASTIILNAPKKYLGNQLSSYTQSLTVSLSLTKPLNVSTATAIITADIQSTYGTTVLFVLSLNASVQHHVATFKLHEHYSANKVSAWNLQHTLSSIKQLSIQFNTVNISHITVSNVELSSVSNSSLASTLSGYMEKCNCPSNFTGRSCQQCASGYTRALPGNDSYTDCKLCFCNSRSLSCNSQNGICENCRLGTEGNYCETCQPGVLQPNCTKCIPGFYGLNDTSFPGCRPCECMLLNTIGGNGSVCDEFSGQCKCRPNIGGRTCDRCAENAINTTASGCQSCPKCYAMIQAEVHALRRDISNITNTLATVKSISQLSFSPTFGQRLDSLTQSVTALAANASNSANIESGLATELAALNVSLDNMQNKLHINISAGINQTNKGLAAVNTTMTEINALQDIIYRLLWASSYQIKGDISRKQNSTSRLRNDLSTISTNLAEKADIYRPIWNTTQDMTSGILKKSTNATNTTSMISKQLATNVLWVNTSTARIQQLKSLTNEVEAKSKKLQNNLSFMLNNISALSVRANDTLSKAIAVNLTTNASAMELQAKYRNLNNDLTALNISLNSMISQHISLNESVEGSKNNSKAILSSLIVMENQTITLNNQVKSSEQKANAAVKSSQNLLKEARDMLKIVQNFNQTSTAAENMASLSLKNTAEVNRTSRQAIANTNQIKTDLSNAVILAEQSVVIARSAYYLASNLSVNLDNLLANATILSKNSSQSRYNDNYFKTVSTNVSKSSNETIQPTSNVCKNITVKANDASNRAKLATQAALNASDEAIAKQAALNKTMVNFQNIALLNTTSLRQLQNTLTKHRDSFTASNVKTMVTQLRSALIQQQSSVTQYKAKIEELKKETSSVKETIGALSTLQGCG